MKNVAIFYYVMASSSRRICIMQKEKGGEDLKLCVMQNN